MTYAVFEGTKSTLLDVDVVGVVKNINETESDLIVLRIQGAKPEYIGVVAGMSGSPVYIRDAEREASMKRHGSDWETKAKLSMVQVTELVSTGMLLAWLLWNEFLRLFVK